MIGARQAGYTIIEVTLFLALSGLLFTIALIGTGNTMRSVRFTDSGRSLTAFMQKQYDEIVNGVNSRSGDERCVGGTVTTGVSQEVGTSNCLLLGKLLLFRTGSPTIQTFTIIGSEPPDVDYNLTDHQLISAFSPKIVSNVSSGTYDIPWQAPISGIRRQSDGQATNALALIRSPKSTRIINYTYKETNPTPVADLSGVVSVAANRGQTTNFCIKNADGIGPPAAVKVDSGSNQGAVQIAFDSNDGVCNGT